MEFINSLFELLLTILGGLFKVGLAGLIVSVIFFVDACIYYIAKELKKNASV